jgi:hypothetical protein
LEIGNWKLEIGNWKLEIGNWKLEIEYKEDMKSSDILQKINNHHPIKKHIPHLCRLLTKPPS